MSIKIYVKYVKNNRDFHTTKLNLPTGNLDSASSKEILQILKDMHEKGKTVILITHDNGIAAQARRVVRIMDGKIESDTINENYGKEKYVKNQLDA